MGAECYRDITVQNSGIDLGIKEEKNEGWTEENQLANFYTEY